MQSYRVFSLVYNVLAGQRIDSCTCFRTWVEPLRASRRKTVALSQRRRLYSLPSSLRTLAPRISELASARRSAVTDPWRHPPQSPRICTEHPCKQPYITARHRHASSPERQILSTCRADSCEFSEPVSNVEQQRSGVLFQSGSRIDAIVAIQRSIHASLHAHNGPEPTSRARDVKHHYRSPPLLSPQLQNLPFMNIRFTALVRHHAQPKAVVMRPTTFQRTGLTSWAPHMRTFALSSPQRSGL